MKRVSEDIEAVGYYYAESAEEVYMYLAPSSPELCDSEREASECMGWTDKKLYRITFKVEPVED